MTYYDMKMTEVFNRDSNADAKITKLKEKGAKLDQKIDQVKTVVENDVKKKNDLRKKMEDLVAKQKNISVTDQQGHQDIQKQLLELRKQDKALDDAIRVNRDYIKRLQNQKEQDIDDKINQVNDKVSEEAAKQLLEFLRGSDSEQEVTKQLLQENFNS